MCPFEQSCVESEISLLTVLQDELSATAGMDSSMDEEEASLDAPCMQIQSAADSGISLSPVITDPEAETTRASSTSSKNGSSCHSTPEKDRDAARVSPEHTQPAVQQDTGNTHTDTAQRLY